MLEDGLTGEGKLLWEHDDSRGVLVEVLTVSLSNAIGEEDADPAEAVLAGIGSRRGRGDEEVEELEEGEGELEGVVTCLKICVPDDGRTRAMSPLGSLVGTSWRPVVFPEVLKKIPFDVVTWASTAGTMWTCTPVSCVCAGWAGVSWTAGAGAGLGSAAAVVEFRQLARCWRSLRLTGGSRPGNLPTSPAHSLNPARNLLSTCGSVAADIAICWRCIVSRCFTVISKMSAFSSLECLAGCNKNNTFLVSKIIVIKIQIFFEKML